MIIIRYFVIIESKIKNRAGLVGFEAESTPYIKFVITSKTTSVKYLTKISNFP